MAHSQVLQESVGIIGTGVAGLINAHVLLQDGFSDVTLITRDKSVGGTWARARVYPGLFINKYDILCFLKILTILLEPNLSSVFGENIVSLLLTCRPQRIQLYATAISQVLRCATIWKSSLKNS